MNCNCCRQAATLLCVCRRPGIYFCEGCFQVHKQRLADFTHVTYPHPFKPDPEAKALILQKIQKILASCENSQQDLYEKLYRTTEVITRIAREQHKILEDLSKNFEEKCNFLSVFIEDLKNLYVNIEKITVLEVKPFFTPIESALQSSKSAESFLSTWSIPQVSCSVPSFNDLIVYIPSNIYESLDSYNFSVSLDDSRFYVKFPSLPISIFQSENINKTSRFLKVSEKSILVTGGESSMGLSYEVNLESFCIEMHSLLGFKRKNHAMAWIDGKPAVIGGEGQLGELKEVEILEFNEWKKLPFSLKKHRSGHTACTSAGKTFIIGGSQTDIEYFDGESWKELEISLGGLQSFPASFNNGNLILFAGSNGGIIYWNLEKSLGVRSLIQNNSDFSNPHISFSVQDNKYTFFDAVSNKLVKFRVLF